MALQCDEVVAQIQMEFERTFWVMKIPAKKLKIGNIFSYSSRHRFYCGGLFHTMLKKESHRKKNSSYSVFSEPVACVIWKRPMWDGCFAGYSEPDVGITDVCTIQVKVILVAMNPVRASKLLLGFICNCLILHNCEDHFHFRNALITRIMSLMLC